MSSFKMNIFIYVMLFIWQIHAMPYNMYNTNDQQDGYCLLYYVYEKDILAYEIIPYCLRSFDKELVDINNTFDLKFTFTQLREKNVSSEMLLSWSSSIDLAEEYEIFLNNLSNSFSSMEKEIFFYNCSSPWFGPFCLFAFDPEINVSFHQIVDMNFNLENNIKYPSLTCYEHLVCERSLCLDWREICDRKIDCLDGSDEVNCWQLEVNECSEDEYRCHNGQCISATFFHDDPNDPDCMDGTDELAPQYSYECAESPAFHCEESTCVLGQQYFPCGDGKCTYGAWACKNGRDTLFLNDSCSKAMGCLINNKYYYNIDIGWCQNFCPNNSCVQDYCSTFYEFPTRSITFGHVRLVYLKRTIEANVSNIPFPDYICYDEKLCEHFPPSTMQINGLTCHRWNKIGLRQDEISGTLQLLYREIGTRFRSCSTVFNVTPYCNHSMMYQCLNSTKCISKHRLLDGIQDCPLNDDETFNQTCPFSKVVRRFNCTINNITNCYSPIILSDNKRYCQTGVDEDEKLINKNKHIDFQKVCDGMVDLSPELIDGQNETDETECEHWPCNNTYTRCSGFWTCKDGADEVNCRSFTCPLSERGCVFFNDTSKVSCLPVARLNDGIIDCLGATDERTYCRYTYMNIVQEHYRCWNATNCVLIMNLCDSVKDCSFGDDEIFCSAKRWLFCSVFDQTPRTEVEQFFCDFLNTKRFYNFRLGNVLTYPVELTVNKNPRQLSIESTAPLIKNDPIVYNPYIKNRRCNRGIPIRIRTSDTTNQSSCLCPPSYYGNKCQYQNERISLTLQIRVIFDWRVMFTFIIILIDDERNIQSYEQIEYLSIRDCSTKFHVYLLYSNRPKNNSKNYSIQIDLFNKVTLEYRASWIFPIQFFFLPVYRLSVLLEVPISEVQIVETCQSPCIHGKCINYVNSRSLTFCQCSSGWSGVRCDIEDRCHCASNSQYVGKSICLCPVGQYGPRCHLRQSLCHSNSCLNDGQCVTKYEQHISSNLKTTMCICPEQYTGDRCEYQQTRLIISFHTTIDIPQWLLIHFIRADNDDPDPIRTSIMKKIVYDQNIVTIYTSISFNLAFVQIIDTYYLIILREEQIDSMNISTMISPSYRCRSIDELFNQTIVHQHILKRIKSYHLPCQQQQELICFNDNIYFCLCNLDRQANCFRFTYNMTYDCDENNFCENGGECFEDNPKCPTSSICICPNCYYGSKCQFSTEGSTLSLDAILGYQIHSNLGINEQSTAVKVGISLSIITLVLGLISSLLSLLTFRMKKTQNVGCGLYLLTSSIVSMITMIVLFLKFWFLLGFQMGSINNRSFLYIQCRIIDYFLRFLLSTGDWLSACVAIERTMNVLKGIHFSKTKSKQIAKWVILFIFILTISTYIHDPIYRDLIDDKQEQRTWCITTYSSSIQKFDWAINILHFSLPFLINISSAFIIIISTARIRSNTQKKQTYQKLLREQWKQHKHLLISPLILFVLALPRLIISFVSGCMKSARNPWLYLIGYFISFTPPMLTFFVFVLPSKIYKEEFIISIQRCWK